MEQDLYALREELDARNRLAARFGEIVERSAAAVLALENANSFPDLKTQLSGLLGVAALAQDPREVRAFLMYQIARKKEWGALGQAILAELKEAEKLPGVSDAGSSPQRVMEAVRAYLGHVRRLYTYVQRADNSEQVGRWQHVRDLAGDRAPQRQAQGGQRDQDRRR
ncbi:MAG: hypothetical protein HPY44_18885 [Armatimonadetes bacterium]|nr:hypothetical protein [Armatimonadota bacterium]